MKTPFAEAAITFTLFIPTRALSAVQQDIQNTQTGWFLSPSYKNVYTVRRFESTILVQNISKKKKRERLKKRGKTSDSEWISPRL